MVVWFYVSINMPLLWSSNPAQDAGLELDQRVLFRAARRSRNQRTAVVSGGPAATCYPHNGSGGFQRLCPRKPLRLGFATAAVLWLGSAALSSCTALQSFDLLAGCEDFPEEAEPRNNRNTRKSDHGLASFSRIPGILRLVSPALRLRLCQALPGSAALPDGLNKVWVRRKSHPPAGGLRAL